MLLALAVFAAEISAHYLRVGIAGSARFLQIVNRTWVVVSRVC